MTIPHKPVKTNSEANALEALWAPKVLAQVNNTEIKIVRFQGEFVWHKHTRTDEAFLVKSGEMTIHLRDGQIQLKEGDLYVIPKNVEHKTSAEIECVALVFELIDTHNYGD